MTTPRQIISPEGRLQGAGHDLHRNQVLEFWRYMLLGRELDLVLQELQQKGQLGPYVSSNGTEACSVGVGAALGARDWFFPSWRMATAALTRDVGLAALIDNALGNERDRAQGRQGPSSLGFRDELIAPVSAPVGTQIAQVVGVAQAARLRGDPVAALALFGSSAWESGDYHSGLNFAGVLKAPAVFVALGEDDLTATAEGYGIAAESVDGDDVLAVFAATSEALERARKGDGPTLLSAIGGNGDGGLGRLRNHLLESGALTAELEREMQVEARAEVKRALTDAQGLGFPAAATLFDDVASRPSPALAWQRDAASRFGAEYGGEEDPEASNILG